MLRVSTLKGGVQSPQKARAEALWPGWRPARKSGSNEEKVSLKWGSLCHPPELGEPEFQEKSYF